MFRSCMIPSLLVCHALVAQAPAAAPAEAKHLSLQDAIRTSLENNLQVSIARESREATVAGVPIAQGAFDWDLTGNLSYSRLDSASSSPIYKGGPVSKTESTTFQRNLSMGVAKPFEWGGNFQLNYSPAYSLTRGVVAATDSSFTTTYPYSGSLSATYTQSLLKNFGRDVTGSQLIVARKGAMAADYVYQKAVIDLVAATEGYYWDVVYAQRNLENTRIALSLAEKQLKENKIRVEVGTMAPIEVTSAEAAVAQQEQNIISAEAQLLNAKDTLIRALYPTSERPAGLELTDAPTLDHIKLDEGAAEKMALERRVELKSAKLDLESKQVLETAAQNRLKPQLDAFATYSGASDNHTALGPVNGDVTGTRYPGYTVGLTFSMPFANHAAKGNLAQARANTRQSSYTLHDQELGIILEVRQAIRNIDAGEKGVKAAEKTRIYREKDLESEQKKFENGMSTNFLVLSKQNDLSSARSAELQAQITYAKAVTALEKAVGNLMEARNLKIQ